MNLKIENLTMKFKEVTAVKDLNLDIEEGTIVTLLGPSGCGKSTTLYTMAGLYKPTKGNIYFNDRIIDNLEPEKRNIGMVFQNYALYPHMTVYKNIEFPLRMKKIKSKEAKEKVESIAKLVKIEDLLERKPSQLSGGQQQRVAIARALVKNPEILLLDEPLSNLDARLRIEMREEIRRIQKELNITTIFVTHDQEEAMTMSDKIALLKKGELQQYDKPENLYIKPNNLFVAKFLGNPAINILEGEVDKNSNFFKIFEGKIILPLDDFIKDKNIEDGTYKIAIRCEDFIIGEKDRSTIKGTIEMTEMIGRDTIIKVKVGNDYIRCIIPYENLNKNEKTVYLNIKKYKIHFFSFEDEKNLLIKGEESE
ncbi:ABC transporter ATP-binding protein [Clostridium sporogenes]|uniref:ABC transporter ATP-binding protein n=1 Tax=Clostridium sporogenes TaxID=1509 RepID=UPI00223857F9|nr:ABC transporter ATP-binding protein [Clostridium sporogenes]MCW6074913.1 ABC transporter ATP-binding protein [Clostridium sporogenes]